MIFITVKAIFDEANFTSWVTKEMCATRDNVLKSTKCSENDKTLNLMSYCIFQLRKVNF